MRSASVLTSVPIAVMAMEVPMSLAMLVSVMAIGSRDARDQARVSVGVHLNLPRASHVHIIDAVKMRIGSLITMSA